MVHARVMIRGWGELAEYAMVGPLPAPLVGVTVELQAPYGTVQGHLVSGIWDGTGVRRE